MDSVTMNISLLPELLHYVDKRVREGKFASRSEFIRHLIREEMVKR